MSIKFLVLGGGVFWVLGGGSADFIFMGARIFLSNERVKRPPGALLISEAAPHKTTFPPWRACEVEEGVGLF